MIYVFSSLTNEKVGEYRTLDDACWNTNISRNTIVNQYKANVFKFTTPIYFRRVDEPLPHTVYIGKDGKRYVNQCKCAKTYGYSYQYFQRKIKKEVRYELS